MKWILFAMTLFAMTASAADVAGTWKGTGETPDGTTVERTFVFKVDGTKLTGETTSQMTGKSTITDGKIEGDKLSFHIRVDFQGNEVKLNYTGAVNGNEMKLHAEAEGSDFTLDYTAKKIS